MKYNLDIQSKVLSNGLKVVLVHKKDYQKSLFLMGIPAGGFNVIEEKDGKRFVNPSGCAHFLEHQMFRLNGEDVTVPLANLQAQANAFTSYTETVYYFSTTADPKEPLKLLMDFVQTLDIDEQSVNKEKGIIVSEYNMYDQQPEQRLIRETFGSLYHTHGLRNEILGTVDDIENMQISDLQTFYNSNYDPSHLILVGVTGKEIEPIMEMIEEHEKNYPSLHPQKIARIIEETEDTVYKKEHTERMDIQKPYVSIGFKMKPVEGVMENLKKDLAVNLWLDQLFGSMNPQYQTWLDEKIISQVAGVEADFTADHAYIFFYAQTDKIEEFKDLVHSLVSQKDLVSEKNFHTMQIQNIARNLRCLDNFENLAIDLVRSYFEGYDYFEAMDQIKELDVATVNEYVANLDFSNESIVTILPEKQ
jgi:predicted Zn-dependent peptidase